MSFLVGPLEFLVRFIHIGAMALWVGLVHFLVFLRPRMIQALSEGTAKEVAPHVAEQVIPWLSRGAVVTVAAGILLYLHRVFQVGLGPIGWAVHTGSLLGLVMIGLTQAVVVPGLRGIAHVKDGAAPPSIDLQRRVQQNAGVVVGLSWLVLALMVWGAH